ncbi:NusB antitermination factor [Sulfobacillus thermosulfidooxidans DSM 9293]|uniref:Transcription antitermination protein NusB n=2 Tax=Sulfobacillus thermosulfidooxidans TaxID=28034 RepID=A0A1W1WJ04_SULTA|nr:transcription antitermination factor NusB [Sulfobacillus thermosulfidooxidans]PSR29216.1 MAG: transcription antitermination factor NusB [Sulfobacillus thermosulfidooxidans]SMC06182.1 NusB antitermination factor [Sulfobacillus thermosulfidooxidans DSM 9293]
MARHHAREMALRVLFEHDLAHTEPGVLVARLQGQDPDDRQFAESIVHGVLMHQDQIDEIIAQSSVDWRIQRMPTIDRNVLRIAVYELLYEPKTPISVIIAEALELAGAYSTDEAKRFVNGVLSTASKTVRPQGDVDRPLADEKTHKENPQIKDDPVNS